MEPFDGGIEANDLASLLYRFEEAVTPPTTPTPTAATSRQAGRVAEVPPAVIASSSAKSKVSALVQTRPKAVYPTTKPNISLLPFSLSPSSRAGTRPPQLSNIVVRASVPSLQPQTAGSTPGLFPGTAFTLVPNSHGTASLLLVKPVAQTTVPKPLPKQVSALSTSKPIKRSVSASALSSAVHIPVTSTSSSLLQTMLLDKNTCIIPKRNVTKKAVSKIENVPKPICLRATEDVCSTVSSLTPSAPVTVSAVVKALPRPILSTRLSQSLPASPSSSKTTDHDYCCSDDIKSQSSQNAGLAGVDATAADVAPAKKAELEVAPFSVEEARAVSSLDAELLQNQEYPGEAFESASSPVMKRSDNNVLEDGEVMVDDDGNDTFPLLTQSVLTTHQSTTDSNLQTSSCQNASLNECSAGSTVAFSLDGKEPAGGRRRGRRYRRRTELSTSPIKEDKTDFFDKIPAFYTALSIPTKPTKTSVFASATKSLGSTDHLAPDHKVHEPVDTGLYDKVPAHRRCFTNTTKEVDVNRVDSSEEQAQQSASSTSLYPMSSSLLSSSSTELNPEVSPPRHSRSRRKTRRRRHLSSCSGSPGDRSRSASDVHSESRSRSRHSSQRLKSCSRSRSSSASSRSCSTCSSCSSGSSCGSSCSGCSRSRSRSSSSCSSYSSSASRSQSPQTKRDWQQRGNRARRSSQSRHRHHHSDKNSWRRSGSTSPARHAGWRSRSRSRRRRTNSRTINDEKIAQKKKAREEEKIKAMEERRVVYVGKIPETYTKRQLYQRFQCFGEIKEVKINFREHGDNYGFVTFTYACDAIAAKEKGNSIEGVPKFDLCFGGRRHFCPDQYADLDGNREIEEEYAPMPKSMSEDLDYAALLRQHTSQQRRGGKL